MTESNYILSTIDARMGEVYLQFFKRNNDKKIIPLSEPMVTAPDKLPIPPDEITSSFSVIGTGYEMFTDCKMWLRHQMLSKKIYFGDRLFKKRCEPEIIRGQMLEIENYGVNENRIDKMTKNSNFNI